jgi:hypothetical protein
MNHAYTKKNTVSQTGTPETNKIQNETQPGEETSHVF